MNICVKIKVFFFKAIKMYRLHKAWEHDVFTDNTQTYCFIEIRPDLIRPKKVPIFLLMFFRCENYSSPVVIPK